MSMSLSGLRQCGIIQTLTRIPTELQMVRQAMVSYAVSKRFNIFIHGRGLMVAMFPRSKKFIYITLYKLVCSKWRLFELHRHTEILPVSKET